MSYHTGFYQSQKLRVLKKRVGSFYNRRAAIITACVVVALVAGLGTLLLFRSHAATATVPLEPENGVLAGAATVAVNSSASNSKAVKFGPAAATMATVTPSLISLSANEISNPMRGQYLWYDDQPATPDGWPVSDSYFRYMWSQLETTQGSYNFSNIDSHLAAAQARGGRFGFRVEAACASAGCGTGTAVAVPSYLASTSNAWTVSGSGWSAKIPDWNNPTFLARWAALMKALGDKYRNDPRLGFIDIGGYGNWGEWHNTPYTGSYPGPNGQQEITLASAKAIIDAVVDNFPNKTVFAQPGDGRFSTTKPGDPTADINSLILQYEMNKSPKIGIRDDCLGGANWMQNAKNALAAAETITSPNGPLDRWKTAPFITEWCNNISPTSGTSPSFGEGAGEVQTYHISLLSSGNFARPFSAYSASQQADFFTANKAAGYRYEVNSVTYPSKTAAGSTMAITASWKNDNVAPTYDNWNVHFELRNPSTQAVVYTGTSKLDLRTLLPATSSTSIADSFNLGTTPVGTYDLVLKIVDPTGYLKPLNLAITNQLSDGGYKLGSVTIN